MSINDQDRKANEPTTSEDAEGEGHAFKGHVVPAENPEVKAHTAKFHV